MLLRNTVQAPGEHVQLARHGDLHNQALALIDEVRVALRPSGELPVKALEDSSLREPSTNRTVEKIQEPIAGGALNGPSRTQVLIL